MPKMKTNRGAAKRFKVTGTGKFLRNHGYHRHILVTKTTKKKRQQRKSVVVSAADAPNLKKLLPYA
jgi:large subunit ribosomal protein L35